MRAVYFGLAMMTFMHLYMKYVPYSYVLRTSSTLPAPFPRFVSSAVLQSFSPHALGLTLLIPQVHPATLHPGAYGPEDALRREAGRDPRLR